MATYIEDYALDIFV